MEYDSINDIKDIYPMKEYFDFDKKVSVINYYLNKCRLLFISSYQYQTNKSVENYKCLMDAYMYVFGIKSMYDKIIGFIEVPKMNDIFYNHMLSIYSLFQNKNLNELWDILLENIDNLDRMCAEDIIQ